MNRPEKFDEDTLSGYIKPEMIQKAPDGFTQRTMIRLQSEKAPVVIREKSYSIPLISGLITLSLIITAALLSSSKDFYPGFSIFNITSRLSLPEFNLEKLFSFSLPALLIYITMGVFLLLLFDQVLRRFFNRERK